jgi:glutamine amidotransferase
MIAIIDYGMGNIHSVQKALESYGAKTTVTNQPQVLEDCDKVVLPGVGAFSDALEELKGHLLIASLIEHIKNKRTFLGICLGMQLLFNESEEAPGKNGLGIFGGEVKKFPDKKSLLVPHMGWNQLKKVASGCPLLKGIPESSYVYFCHSYYPEVLDQDIIAATTDYGLDFPAVIWKDNIYGVQFHPEKSQEIGLRMIKNFVQLC